MVATPALFALCCGGEGRAPADAGAADLAASDAIHDGPVAADTLVGDGSTDRPPVEVDAGSPGCEFLIPRDGNVIADTQTPVEVQTQHVSQGTVVALLVDFVPRATAPVDAHGRVEFPSIELGAPSSAPVELRAEVRLHPSHKTTCWIHVTVAP